MAGWCRIGGLGGCEGLGFEATLLIPVVSGSPRPCARCMPVSGRAARKPDDSVGRTPMGSCNRTLLRRVLRRFFKGSAFLEGFLEGALKGFQFLEGFLEGGVVL